MDSPAEFVSQLAVNVLSDVLKQSVHGLKSAAAWLTSVGREYDPFGLAVRRYGESLQVRYGSVRIFGMSRPLPLRDLFVRVNILPKTLSHQRISAEELERLFDWETRKVEKVPITVDALDLVARAATNDQNQHILVLGKPGAGKSTLLKYVMLQALAGKLPKARIPIVISLKDWSDSGIDLFDFIVKQFDICDFPDATSFVKRILEKGSALLLLDGLDEITRRPELCIRTLREFAFQFRQNHFLITCRVAAYEYVFDQFLEVEIADFNDNQIDLFVKQWFGVDIVKASLCREELNDPKNVPIRELCRTPLLLTMLCVAFDELMTFPTSRAQLYAEAIDALLKKWDTSRGIKRIDIYQRLSVRHKQDMLSAIAFEAFKRRQHFFRAKWLEEQVDRYLINLPGYGKSEELPDVSAVVRSIESHHGLLIERAHRVYSFSHLTVQEYFAARYLAIVDAGTVALTIEQFLLDAAWREVFLLCVELVPNADALLLAMRKTVGAIAAESPELQEFLRQLPSAIRDGTTYPAPVCRAVVLSEVDDQYFRAFSGAVSEHAVQIAQQLGYSIESYSLIFGVNPHGQHKSAQFADRDRCKALAHTSAKTVSSDAMLRYVRGTRLIVDCLSAEAYVTRRVRGQLVDSILAEPFAA